MKIHRYIALSYDILFVFLVLPYFILACGPTVEEGRDARIAVHPRTTVSFAQVAVGDSAKQSLLIRNIGKDTLSVSRIEWGGASSVVVQFEAASLPVKLEHGEELSLDFVFTPTEDEADPAGILWIYSNDPDKAKLGVEVLSQQMAAQIHVSPSSAEGLILPQTQEGSSSERMVVISNVGDLPLDISKIELKASSEFSISWGEAKLPVRLRAHTSDALQVAVVFKPRSEGKRTGSLLIHSNDPQQGVYTLPITANSATPCLLIKPRNLEFNNVSVGTEQTKTVELHSCSSVPLVLDVQSQGSGPFSYQLQGQHSNLVQGEFAELQITYSPRQVGSHQMSYIIVSNDPLSASSEVKVLGIASDNSCPTAVLRGRVSTASDWTRSILASPLDTVTLDASLSSDKESHQLSYHWSVKERAEDSTSLIQAAEAQGSFFVDLEGDYELCLDVEDSEGMMSCNTDCISVSASLKQKLHIQLEWRTPQDPVIGDEDGTDLDLHFVRVGEGKWGDKGDPSRNNGSDVYFLNQHPVWDIEGGSVENPSLDRDDKDGEGPENVSLDNPNACSWYAVGVHYFNDYGFGPSYAAVRIYINGEMRFEKANLSFMRKAEFMQLAFIHWDGSTARAFEHGIKYDSDADWIGIKPLVPSEIEQRARDAAPDCF
ncbi:MAG: choice-of-anchor D domain-containing protein [Bradymonadia bacterium]|jgi:hypothetical protein